MAPTRSARWLKANKDTLVVANCVDYLPTVPDGVVDLVLTDLPYGTTRNKWDSVIDLDFLWAQWWRVLKPNGAVVLTAAQPFTSTLVASNPGDFKVEYIWLKTLGSGQLNISHQPLRVHESVLVFYRARPTYNEQLTQGEPYVITRDAAAPGPTYNPQKPSAKINTGYRHAKTVLPVPNPRIKGGHPAAKPVALFEHFIATYSDPGDLVLDCAIGAGTTAIAANNLGRHFIGCDTSADYIAMANSALAL